MDSAPVPLRILQLINTLKALDTRIIITAVKSLLNLPQSFVGKANFHRPSQAQTYLMHEKIFAW